MEWQPIATAPKTGDVLLHHVGDEDDADWVTCEDCGGEGWW